MTSPDEPDVQPIDILLIEPSPGDARLFAESFTDGSITNYVFTVTDEDEALEFLRQRGEYADAPRPDLVLLEPRLPGTTGADVLSELTSEGVLEGIPVVVLTSSEAEEEFLRSQDVEVETYIEKPVEAEDFVRFVQSVEDFWFTIVKRVEAD